ncbi:Lumazine-binding protein [Daldinia loculata]|uniref:Lumazine-binding protein n=1 Tax=Daldinia loculata TaxID=103429 RepID=UPI0020C58215|nr:Lumazine-binding protein [Daldinia loculata]KAI1649865.1 Lumazine-binding protein [Daldinia loculata]
MFTGLVEEIGVVAELNPHDETGGTSLTIALPASSKLLEGALLGDSISVNGVCLTATNLGTTTTTDNGNGNGRQPSFKVGIAPETLRLTNLGDLKKDSPVNLERAVRADTRMGGHFVQGHVDTTADVVSVTPDGNALTVRLAPKTLDALKYVVHKGYVALDGTSLTVTRVDDAEGWFEIMLIAYTQERVVLARKSPGDSVNLEVDVLAKYAEKSMAGYLGAQGEVLVRPMLEDVVRSLVAQAMGGHS